jgi:hypothetical protein
MRNTVVTGGKPIAVLLQSISGVCAINPLVDFYDIRGRKREVLFFCFVPDTIIIIIISLLQSTVGHKPLQCLAISLDLRLLASSFCQPSYASLYSTWPEGVLHYVYLDAVSTPELVYPRGYRFYG